MKIINICYRTLKRKTRWYHQILIAMISYSINDILWTSFPLLGVFDVSDLDLYSASISYILKNISYMYVITHFNCLAKLFLCNSKMALNVFQMKYFCVVFELESYENKILWLLCVSLGEEVICDPAWEGLKTTVTAIS